MNHRLLQTYQSLAWPDEPITDGMEVYLSMIVVSPFGQMTAAHANTLELRVNEEWFRETP